MALDLVLMMLNSIGRDVGRRRFRLVVCLAVVCALLTGCSAEPMTAREATTWLRQTFEGKFRLKLQEAGTTREGRPQQIYWYTDQDGRQFWVKSSVVTNSLLGWLEEATITNYLSVWYESRMAELSSILGSYDVDFDGGDIYITITVTTQCEYRDLDPLSEAVARAMNAVKSPLKTDNYISMPKIDINCEGGAGVAGKTIFLGGWDLPLVGGRVDAESLLARFQWN